MWPRIWQKSHPVTGPDLNCLRQEYADWDIHPPAIVPLLISSHRTLFQFELFTEVKWEDLQVWSADSQKKKAAPDIWKWKLQLMVAVPEPSDNFKWLVLSEPTLRTATLKMQREKKNHLREAGTEIWHFYIKYSAARQSFLIDASFHLSSAVTCGRDLKFLSFSNLKVSSAVQNDGET